MTTLWSPTSEHVLAMTAWPEPLEPAGRKSGRSAFGAASHCMQHRMRSRVSCAKEPTRLPRPPLGLAHDGSLDGLEDAQRDAAAGAAGAQKEGVPEPGGPPKKKKAPRPKLTIDNLRVRCYKSRGARSDGGGRWQRRWGATAAGRGGRGAVVPWCLACPALATCLPNTGLVSHPTPQAPSGLKDVFDNFPRHFADGFGGRGNEVRCCCRRRRRLCWLRPDQGRQAPAASAPPSCIPDACPLALPHPGPPGARPAPPD